MSENVSRDRAGTKKEVCLQAGRKKLPALQAHLSCTLHALIQPDNQILLKTYLRKECN